MNALVFLSDRLQHASKQHDGFVCGARSGSRVSLHRLFTVLTVLSIPICLTLQFPMVFCHA
jgi:hypothetical protein